MRLARATCEDAARRLGMSRRDFLRSSMASAATLLAIGACSDDDDGGPSAGTFDVPPESTTEPEVGHDRARRRRRARSRRAAAPPRAGRLRRGFGSSFPQADCGDGDACFDTEHWLDLVFGRSDTTMAVLSAIPVLGDPDPLSAEVMDAARRAADELCGDGRVLVQGHAQPNVGRARGARSTPCGRRPSATRSRRGSRTPTSAGRGGSTTTLGEAFLALVEEIGPPIVCVHKGLGGDPSDVGPAAAAHPDITFVAYHSGYETSACVEGAYDARARPTAASTGCSSRCGPPASGRAATCTPSSGSTWRMPHGRPRPGRPPARQADRRARPRQRPLGHRLDLVRLTAGPDRAFRTFEITAEAQERFGYAPLTTEVKAGILAGNAAAPLRRRPGRRARARRPSADRAARRADPPYPDRPPRPEHRRGRPPVFAADHPWF